MRNRFLDFFPTFEIFAFNILSHFIFEELPEVFAKLDNLLVKIEWNMIFQSWLLLAFIFNLCIIVHLLVLVTITVVQLLRPLHPTSPLFRSFLIKLDVNDIARISDHHPCFWFTLAGCNHCCVTVSSTNQSSMSRHFLHNLPIHFLQKLDGQWRQCNIRRWSCLSFIFAIVGPVWGGL